MSASEFIRRFRKSGPIREIEERSNFAVAMTVELHDVSLKHDAAAFVASDHIAGKNRIERNMRSDQIWWHFEDVSDGVLFKLKFGCAPLPDIS